MVRIRPHFFLAHAFDGRLSDANDTEHQRLGRAAPDLLGDTRRCRWRWAAGIIDQDIGLDINANILDQRVDRCAVGHVAGHRDCLDAMLRLYFGGKSLQLVGTARRHDNTSAPSSANRCAIARPSPRLAPKTRAFFPFNPRSMNYSPNLRFRWLPRQRENGADG